MDYSLLVGVHFRNDNTVDKMGLSPFVLRGTNSILRALKLHFTWVNIWNWSKSESFSFPGKRDSYQNEKYLRGRRFLEAELQDMDRVLAGRCAFSSLITVIIELLKWLMIWGSRRKMLWSFWAIVISFYEHLIASKFSKEQLVLLTLLVVCLMNVI